MKRRTYQELLKRIELLENKLALSEMRNENIPGYKFETEAWIESGVYYVKCLWASLGSLIMTGYTWEEIVAMDSNFGRTVFHPLDFALSLQSFEFLCRKENTGKIFTAYFYYRDGNGDYVPGIGFVRVIGIDEASGHLRFMNLLTPVDKNTQVSKSIKRLMADQHRKGKELVYDDITPTEMIVLKQLVHEADVIKVAENLFKSEKTILKHINNLYEKFDIHSLAALIVFAIDIGVE